MQALFGLAVLLVSTLGDYGCDDAATGRCVGSTALNMQPKSSAAACMEACEAYPNHGSSHSCCAFTPSNGGCHFILAGDFQADPSSSDQAGKCCDDCGHTHPAPPGGEQSQCSTVDNTDMGGTNLAGSPVSAAAYGDCCTACTNFLGCKAWTWFDGSCWLKGAIGPYTHSTGHVSGVLSTSGFASCNTQTGRDYSGFGVHNVGEKTGITTAQHCCEECYKVPACKAWTLKPSEGKCWLKDGVPGWAPYNMELISGSKTGVVPVSASSASDATLERLLDYLLK